MSLETTAPTHVDEQTDLSNSLEINDSLNGRVTEFWSFVAENSGVIVESPRLPGVEMAFGALMAMCAAAVTEQNVDRFYAESHALLANANVKTDEVEEKSEDLEDHQLTESEVKNDKPKAERTVEKVQPKNEEPLTIVPEPAEVAKRLLSDRVSPPVAAPEDASYTFEGPSPLEPQVELKDITSPQPEERPIVVAKEVPKTAVLTVASSSAAEPPQPEIKSVVVAEPARAKEPFDQAVKTNELKSDEAVRPIIEHEESILRLDELRAKPETNEEPAESPVEQTEFEFQLPAEVNDELGINWPVRDIGLEFSLDSNDAEFDFHDFSEDFPLPQWSEEKPLFVMLEEEYEMLSAELSIPAKEVEETINQLTEKVDALKPEAAEEVRQILDEIAELPQRLEFSDEDEPVNEKEVREELESSFAELFDRLNIEYSPELLHAFATLTLNNQLEEVLGVKEGDELVYEIPTERGTHEFITKLLISFAKLKKALLHAYLLGKSALHLYTIQKSTS
ncbi:MAG: hypothetical protein WEC17_01650 [Candidatus Saccharimonadales bacterium]